MDLRDTLTAAPIASGLRFVGRSASGAVAALLFASVAVRERAAILLAPCLLAPPRSFSAVRCRISASAESEEACAFFRLSRRLGSATEPRTRDTHSSVALGLACRVERISVSDVTGLRIAPAERVGGSNQIFGITNEF